MIYVLSGGLYGSFCALASARRGRTVVFIQDRPMLGGNENITIDFID